MGGYYSDLWDLDSSPNEREPTESLLEIAHELGACGGDCPWCQRERMEQRDEKLMELGDPDYPGEELDVP